MKLIIIGFLVLAVLLMLGFVGWVTGGSPFALAAAFFLLICTGAWGARAAGLTNIPTFVRSLVGWMAVLCLVVIGWAAVAHQWETRWKPAREAKRQAKIERAAAATYAASHPPAAAQVVKIGKQPTTYKFSDYANQCVSLDIRVYDFYWYPKGGKVTVCPPKEECFVDTPGVNITTHYEPGTWKWCGKDLDAWGVEVWQ